VAGLAASVVVAAGVVAVSAGLASLAGAAVSATFASAGAAVAAFAGSSSAHAVKLVMDNKANKKKWGNFFILMILTVNCFSFRGEAYI
jgi:Kef-type K+ transport system membrane component KefB